MGAHTRRWHLSVLEKIHSLDVFFDFTQILPVCYVFFPNSERFRVLVGVKDKVSTPCLPGNVRFGRRIGANGGRRPVTRTGSSVTVSVLRV